VVCIIATSGARLSLFSWPQKCAAFGVEACYVLQTPLECYGIRSPTKMARSQPRPSRHSTNKELPLAIGGRSLPRPNIFLSSDNGLTPHLVRTFKVSKDPDFASKVRDITGLYLDPPDKALVLSVDEKSQIQALDRTQPGLPMKKGRAGTMTHDYKRNGTTTLFAALDVATGKVIGECLPRHRATEFLRFLKKIDLDTPARLDLHLILDNYSTHKTPAVTRWLKRHPRFKLHFTPTSCS
jgi:transposase